MYQKVLNGVIVISAIGLGLLMLYDIVTKDPTSTRTKQSSISAPTNPVGPKSDMEAACINDYFNFDKKAIWNYRLTNTITTNGSTEIFTEEFTNTIAEVLSSSIVINSKSKDYEKKYIITCKESGIYGFPFPAIISSALYKKEKDSNKTPDLLNSDTLANLSINIRLIPDIDTLYMGSSWVDTAHIALRIPIIGKQKLPFLLSNSISNQNKKEGSITIESTFAADNAQVALSLNQNPMLKNVRISKEIKKNVGITKLYININLGEEGLESMIELIKYSP